MKLGLGFYTGIIGLFGCIVVSKILTMTSEIDIRLPFADEFVEANTLISAPVAFVERFILHLFWHRRGSQILKSIGGFLPIPVIDAIKGPFASLERPDNAMGESGTANASAGEVDPDIASVAISSDSADEFSLQPDKLAGFLVVAQSFAQFFDWDVNVARVHETLYNVSRGAPCVR